MKRQTVYKPLNKMWWKYVVILIMLAPAAVTAQRPGILGYYDVSLQSFYRLHVWKPRINHIALPFDSSYFYDPNAKKRHIRSEIDMDYTTVYDTAGYITSYTKTEKKNSPPEEQYTYGNKHRTATLHRSSEKATVFLNETGYVDSVDVIDTFYSRSYLSKLYYQYDSLHRLTKIIEWSQNISSVLYEYSYSSGNIDPEIQKVNYIKQKYITRKIKKAFDVEEDVPIVVSITYNGKPDVMYEIYIRKNRLFYEVRYARENMDPLNKDNFGFIKQNKLFGHTYSSHFSVDDSVYFEREHIFFSKWIYSNVSKHRRKLTPHNPLYPHYIKEITKIKRQYTYY